MQLMFIVSGEYTNEQLQQAVQHLAVLRDSNPDISINFTSGPKCDMIEQKLSARGCCVKRIPLSEFMQYSINNLSNTLN